ncbi:MAG TPA: class II glutamine amidotransferase [Gaiellales bacterium]
MCRLFGLSAAPNRVDAGFWLLDAPDSILAQSHRNPDGTGLGYFDAAGAPVIDKQPLAAFNDRAFAREARHVISQTFITHVRLASTGGLTRVNTHPFAIGNRIMAHNGALGDLPRLEAELGDGMGVVQGDTDSERMFALIAQRIDAAGGDVGAGIAAATGWIAAHLPVYSLNLILITAAELWALRYPETHRLYVLERAAGGVHGGRPLHQTSATLRVHSEPLAGYPSVVVASEPLDEHPGWRLLDPGELVHVAADLGVSSRIALADPPAQPMQVSYLHGAPQP